MRRRLNTGSRPPGDQPLLGCRAGQIEHKHVAAIARTAGSADQTTSSCTEVIAGTRRDDNEERGDERGWLRLAPATESTALSALRQLPF